MTTTQIAIVAIGIIYAMAALAWFSFQMGKLSQQIKSRMEER